MRKYLILGGGCLLAGGLLLYALVASGALPPDLQEILSQGKVIRGDRVACFVEGEYNLYRIFLDLDENGKVDVGIMGEIREKVLLPPLVWIFYDGRGEAEKAILTLPGQEIQRITFQELLRQYPTPCMLIGREVHYE